MPAGPHEQHHEHEQWRARALRAEAELQRLKEKEARLLAELRLVERAARQRPTRRPGREA